MRKNHDWSKGYVRWQLGCNKCGAKNKRWFRQYRIDADGMMEAGKPKNYYCKKCGILLLEYRVMDHDGVGGAQ